MYKVFIHLSYGSELRPNAHQCVCLFQEMADGLAKLKNMHAALDILQKKEDAIVAREEQEPSSGSDDTSSPPRTSAQVLTKLAEAFDKPAYCRQIKTWMSSTMYEVVSTCMRTIYIIYTKVSRQ